MGTKGQQALEIASDKLGISQEDLLLRGLHHYLQSQLREVQADIFQIIGQYGVSTVADMEALYREGEIEEATSWRDMQRLDHLEYKRDRLLELLSKLP